MKPPAFQFYVDDFLGGTMHFTDAEVGLYVRLLCVQWSTGHIPDDDAEIASYGKGGTSIARVKMKFPAGADGLLRNVRLELERQKQSAWRAKSSAGGKRSAQVKGGSTTIEPPLNHRANQTPTLHSPPSSLLSPSSTEGAMKFQSDIGLMFNRKPDSRWDYTEEHALAEVLKRADHWAELTEIKSHLKKLSQDDRRFFPRSVGALLSKWTATLDVARTEINGRSRSFQDITQGNL